MNPPETRPLLLRAARFARRQALACVDRLRSVVSRITTDLSIFRKYRSDKRALPLDARHRRLFFIIHRNHVRQNGCFPCLTSPQTYNDKIAWLQLFDQRWETVTCSDKIAARDYVAKTVGDDCLNELYGIFGRFEDIDQTCLPDSFVIKANHDSGTVVLVKDKASVDWETLRVTFDRAMSRRYGKDLGEWNYAFIVPRILVERHLNAGTDVPPPDYKLHCANGHVAFIQYIFDRNETPKQVIFDRSWHRLELHFDQHFQKAPETIPPPPGLQNMITTAETLSAPFKYVRIDMYNVAGRTLFGEMTFFPLAGCYNTPDLQTFGDMLNFSTADTRPPIYQASPAQNKPH